MTATRQQDPKVAGSLFLSMMMSKLERNLRPSSQNKAWSATKRLQNMGATTKIESTAAELPSTNHTAFKICQVEFEIEQQIIPEPVFYCELAD